MEAHPLEEQDLLLIPSHIQQPLLVLHLDGVFLLKVIPHNIRYEMKRTIDFIESQ
jgi:hypothetical protein